MFILSIFLLYLAVVGAPALAVHLALMARWERRHDAALLLAIEMGVPLDCLPSDVADLARRGLIRAPEGVWGPLEVTAKGQRHIQRHLPSRWPD